VFCFKSVRLEVITLLPFAQAELAGPRGDQLDRMPRLLDVLAAHAGQLVNHSCYGAALGLTVPTAQKYVGILERLFLLELVPPWSHNAVSSLTKTPKLHFLDSGLRQLQAAVGDKFVQGLVLHDHDRITPFDEKLHAAPVSMLWQG
jgi:predicted AAA+ superfamily ATPase